jgi:hypothetical protein
MRSDRSHSRTFVPFVALALVACLGPARTSDVYAGKAENSIETARSGVETTLAAIDVAVGRGAFAPFVAITIQDADAAVAGAESGFASIQPPDQASDELRQRVLPVLSEAADVVGRARIAARRVDVSALAGLRGELDEASGKLDGLLGMLA